MDLYDEFATVAARGEYPSWFYAAWNVASLKRGSGGDAKNLCFMLKSETQKPFYLFLEN